MNKMIAAGLAILTGGLLITGFVILIFLKPGGLFLTEDKPWDLPKPEGMTKAHEGYAIAARKFEISFADGRFGFDPLVAKWDGSGGRNRALPMSNMTRAGLRSLFNGRYHITSTEDGWLVSYYAHDGKTHFCAYNATWDDYDEWSLDRYISKSAFGLYGVFHWDPTSEETETPEGYITSFPVVVDGSKGLVFYYAFDGEKFNAEPGWIQDEYATVFWEVCPNLPQVNNINQDQSEPLFSDLISAARPITNINTAFRNDPLDPMTASMYYWFNPPK